MLQRFIALTLTILLLTDLSPKAFSGQDIGMQIKALPLGTKIELRLKNKTKMRGTTAAATESAFTLTDAGAVDHQIAFDDIASVKRISGKPSHRTRNILIIAGLGVVLTAIGILVYAKECAPFGCNAKPIKL